MEGKRSSGASTSSSSSLVSELFGGKDSSGKSSSGIFGSIFPPASTVAGNRGGRKSTSDGIPKSKPSQNRDKSSSSSAKMDPCLLSSSVYYGGQDFYRHPGSDSSNFAASHNKPFQYRKEGESESDPIDSRGDWWQGSLYY